MEIKDQYKNKNGNLDVQQLMDDLDQYTTDSDKQIIQGMKAELDKRMKAELEAG